MRTRFWLGALAGLGFAAALSMPGLPVPGAERLGFGGTAAAQEAIDIDTFYDALDPYGQWVWHPRFGYVWLPEDVSPNWRPYTVGRWTYTDEYGWYWDSYEPFAWAVYHYGRWGYDPDYGWFWVPGDTWAPAWVQWRYSDNYVGWAPIGPRRNGYAYGVPVDYDPPIAESWVFVQPRYLTSRAISHYALPIGAMGPAFLAATNVYRPQYRDGIVFNFGMPRDRVVKIIKRPIYVQKIYKVNNWKAGGFDKKDFNKGLKIYAPGFNKNGGNRGPKRFADHPNDFKPKAKLKDVYKGDLPKGWGESAKNLKSIAKQDPDAFSKKHGKSGPDDEADRGNNDSGNNKGKDNNNKDKNQVSKGDNNQDNDKTDKFRPGGPNGFDQFKQGKGDYDKNGGKGDNNKTGKTGGDKNANDDANSPPPPANPPPVQKIIRDQGNGNKATTGNQIDAGGSKQGSRDDNDKTGKGNNTKNKNNFGNGGPGGGSQFNQSKQGSRNDDSERGDNNTKNKNFGSQGSQNPSKQGNRNGDNNSGNNNRNKNNFGNQGGGSPGGFRPGTPNQFKQNGGGGDNERAQDGGGGDKDKCKKHPEKCQNQN